MAFNVICDNKECRKDTEPVIDKRTRIVYCGICGNELKDQKIITEFAKNQMVSLGQVRRAEKKQQAFAVKCASCDRESQPKLDKSGKVLQCSNCSKELKNLSPPFAQMLKDKLRKK